MFGMRPVAGASTISIFGDLHGNFASRELKLCKRVSTCREVYLQPLGV